MIYQKIFTDEKPYRMTVGSLGGFPEHRHADFELNFCIEGSFDILVDRQPFSVNEGQLTFVPSMCSHSFPVNGEKRTVLTLIVGTALLKNSFNEINRLASELKILDLNLPENRKIKDLLLECKDELECAEPDELLLIGNVYKIMSLLKKTFCGKEKPSENKADLFKVENIEKALDLIYYRYKEPLCIEYAAELTGYSRSNFCKTFKKIVGESFHTTLNRQRIRCSLDLLRATDLSVAEIASEVGFSDAKSFCRVFGSLYGTTPGKYRKNKDKIYKLTRGENDE